MRGGTMIHFYGAPMSSAGRTHWMLEEVGVPYEYHRVNLRDEASRNELRAINPGGKIPFIVDGDVALAESAAINFYLADRYKPALMPADVGGRARVLQWSFWAMTNLQPRALDVMFHAMMLPAEKRNAETLASAKQTSQALLDHFETEVGTYLVGDRLSVADVIAGSVVNLALRAGAATGGPKTTAWIEALRARPGYQKAATGG
jgi:glutathione S-transferase